MLKNAKNIIGQYSIIWWVRVVTDKTDGKTDTDAHVARDKDRKHPQGILVAN